MSDRDDFYFGCRLTKHNNIGKATEYLPANIKCQLRELARSLLNAP